jgi:hypothetical protein
MAADVIELFRVLHKKSTPLIDELAEQMRRRATILGRSKPDAREVANRKAPSPIPVAD